MTHRPIRDSIKGKSDIKNYADYLYQNAAPAILSWMIEGAKEAIDLDFRIPLPGVVENAITSYREQNDWMAQFLEERCLVDEKCEVRSSDLYKAYRQYCIDCNEYVRGTADFYTALQNLGFVRHRTARANLILGLKLLPEENPSPKAEFDDFMS